MDDNFSNVRPIKDCFSRGNFSHWPCLEAVIGKMSNVINDPLWLFVSRDAALLKQCQYAIAPMNRRKTIGPVIPAASTLVEDARLLVDTSTCDVG